MLPYIVITAAIIFFLLRRSGIFDDLGDQEGKKSSSRQSWGRRILRELERDPEMNQRLEVFKDFLESQQDEEE